MKSSLKPILTAVAVIVGAIMSAAPSFAQDNGALVDALVRKGLITAQEGEEIRTDLTKEYTSTPAGKLNVSSHIKKLKIYGDARWRYEYASQKSQAPVSPSVAGQPAQASNSDVWRGRYRIRLGIDYAFTDNFSAGWELESSQQNDGANQNIGSGFGKFSINTGLLYLTWKATDWATLTGGKFRNPFYTTDMLWDPDINPEGAVEILSWNISDNLTVGLTLAELYYTENTESNSTNFPFNQNNANDSWILAAQVPITYKFDGVTSATIAPAFYKWTNGSTTPITTGTATGSPGYANLNGASYLNLVTAPGDIKFAAWNKPVRFYWDFVYNTSGKDRFQDSYGVGAPAAYLNQNRDLSDDVAWLAGIQFGENKKKGDWIVAVDFRQVGLNSVDPNLSDSDWGRGYLNQQGVKVRLGYNFTDFLVGNITYFDTWNYKNDLLLPSTSAGGAGSSTTANLTGVNNTNCIQFDLNWKF